MTGRMSVVLTDAVSILLIVCMVGCSLDWSRERPRAALTEEELKPQVARIIEENYEVVKPFLEADSSARALGSLYPETIDGLEAVEMSLNEEMGQEYLEFCYHAAQGTDASQVLRSAHELLDDESYAELEKKYQETERTLEIQADATARSLPPSQRAQFAKDMQSLVTRTLVLLTAGIVYACIPTVIFWGKISAAAAVAVATGVVATTVISVWRYYQFNQDIDEAFGEWLTSVSTEPELAYALAASVMALGSTLKRGPVVTGIVMAVFAIYNVVDMVRPMLKIYNFSA